MHLHQLLPSHQDKLTLNLAGAEITDQGFPVPMLLANYFEHRKVDKALHVDLGPSGATNDVFELKKIDPYPIAVLGFHDDSGRQRIEALPNFARRSIISDHVSEFVNWPHLKVEIGT